VNAPLRAVVVVLTLLCARTALAQNEICVPATGTPTLDGVVIGDPGWDGSARIDLDCSGTVPETYVRWVRTATHVYMGLVVKTPGIAPDLFDRVVLAFRTLDDASAWRIHIEPFGLSTPLGAGHPSSVRFWRGSSNWNSGGVMLTPANGNGQWLMPAEIPLQYLAGTHWEMELRIPIEANATNALANNGIFFPAVGTTFKLYVNVVKASGSGFACQYPWRSTSIITPTLLTGTPSSGQWGTASFDDRPGCAVQLYTTKIGLIAPPCPSTHEVVPYTPAEPFGDCAALPEGHLYPTTGPSNTFFAKPRNRMAAQAHVRTAFDVSDWGIPAPEDWWRVGYPEGWPAPMTNPPSILDINPGAEATLTLDWPLTYKQSCQLAVPQKSIRVEMSKPDGDDVTHFGANPVVRSYDAVSASVFERDARVGTRGYPAPASGRQAFVLTVGKDVVRRAAAPRPLPPRLAAAPAAVAPAALAAARRAPLPDELLYEDAAELARRSFPPAVDETFQWVCRAYRKTGRTLAIDDKPSPATFADTEAAGAFGYLAGHRGPVERWTSEFSGPGLRSVAEGLFELDVPHGQKGLVRTRIEAESFHEWELRVRLGAAIPHADYADLVDAGWSELVSLEYRINPMFSVEARLGVAAFDGKDGGPDVYSVQHAINGRFTLPLDGPFRPFLNIGPGFFANNPGDDGFGANVGLGVGYRVSDFVSIEAAIDHFHVFAHGENPHFSTLQLGVGLKF
jgi:hypothetical protein